MIATIKSLINSNRTHYTNQSINNMASKKEVKVDKIELLISSANLVTWKDDFKDLA
jgi:hypothetical protein